MAYVPTLLYPSATPSDSGETIYTVPGTASVIVKNVVLTNTTGSEATVNLHVVPAAGSAQASNQILANYPVPANGVATLDCSIVMNANSFLYALNGTAGAVVVTVSGVEIV